MDHDRHIDHVTDIDSLLSFDGAGMIWFPRLGLYYTLLSFHAVSQVEWKFGLEVKLYPCPDPKWRLDSVFRYSQITKRIGNFTFSRL